MYKITLSDGVVLDNIEINGSTYVSKVPIDISIFEHNLSPVDIEHYGNKSPYYMLNPEGHHENMTAYLIDGSPEGEYWFTLMDVPESEMRYVKMRSDIEYIAMMNDVEL